MPKRERQRTVGEAIAVFLERSDLAAQSRRSYGQTLNRIATDVGDDELLSELDSDRLAVVLVAAWGDCSPATWNRHIAIVRSFVAYCNRRAWLTPDVVVGVDRRREPADRTRAIPYAQLERLWRRDDVSAREKALWRMLYETATRASEVLSVNVETSTTTTAAPSYAARPATSTSCTSRPARRD